MTELFTERWTLVVAALWVVMACSIAWWWQRFPLALTYPGIAFAWGLGFLHNAGIFPDGGYG
ncbi:MAG TPA: hypothetical protein PKA06_12465 [Gemmatales bacterium]|nr:hypothetical protein [Gemmatales bacterium]HMP16816.1 hypothetical protein [Gemmatales bacterium]